MIMFDIFWKDADHKKIIAKLTETQEQFKLKYETYYIKKKLQCEGAS